MNSLVFFFFLIEWQHYIIVLVTVGGGAVPECTLEYELKFSPQNFYVT